MTYLYNNKIHPSFLKHIQALPPEEEFAFIIENKVFMDNALFNKAIENFLYGGGYKIFDHQSLPLFLEHANLMELDIYLIDKIIDKCIQYDMVDLLTQKNLKLNINRASTLKTSYLKFMEPLEIDANTQFGVMIDYLDDEIINKLLSIMEHIHYVNFETYSNKEMLFKLVDKIEVYNPLFMNLHIATEHFNDKINEDQLITFLFSTTKINTILNSNISMNLKRSIFDRYKKRMNDFDIYHALLYTFNQNTYEIITDELFYDNIDTKKLLKLNTLKPLEMKIFISYLLLRNENKKECFFDLSEDLFSPFILHMLDIFNIDIEIFAEDLIYTQNIDQTIKNLCIPNIYNTYKMLDIKISIQDVIHFYETENINIQNMDII